MDWVLDEHFIFLGYREYRLENDDNLDLFAIGNSGLGLLRGGSEDTLSKSFDELPHNLKKVINRATRIDVV